MADDDRRVEPRLRMTGTGAGVTPESIAELEQRVAQMEKSGRAAPVKAFSAVLSEHTGDRSPSKPDPKAERLAALPKRGPRPSLLHPAQREAYGRDEASDDPVVIKG